MKNIIAQLIGFIINLISLISLKLAARIALFLFSKPFKGKNNEAEYDFLDTAFKEDLDYSDTITIRTYRWIGKNKTILLAHGWESNSARWKELIHKLKQQDYNIVALDAPAHGLSGSKRFNAVLYSEFINVVVKRFKPEIIIGHSVGGMASIFYQYKYQNSIIDKLILLGAPSNFTGVFKRYTSMMGYNKKIINKIDNLVLEQFGHLPGYFSAANFSKDIMSSGLIIHDEKDKVIPYSDAEDYERNYKNSKLISTTNSGHSLNNDRVINHISEFITS